MMPSYETFFNFLTTWLICVPVVALAIILFILMERLVGPAGTIVLYALALAWYLTTYH